MRFLYCAANVCFRTANVCFRSANDYKMCNTFIVVNGSNKSNKTNG